MAPRDQQTFIQILMHKGIINNVTMKQLCRKIFGNEETKVAEHVAKVNRDLKDLGMGITSACCELTGEKYWLFTSTIIPELENFNYENKPFLEFTKSELKFLIKIFGDIIGSDEGYISSINCINSVEQMEDDFTRSQADEFIKKMTLKRWLSLKDGQIYLGVRSIAEFMPLFKAKFKDHLENCYLCKLAVFYGQNCENCNAKFHIFCLAKAVEINRNAKCLNCHSALNVPSTSIDESYMDTGHQPDPRNNPELNTSRRSRRVRT